MSAPPDRRGACGKSTLCATTLFLVWSAVLFCTRRVEQRAPRPGKNKFVYTTSLYFLMRRIRFITPTRRASKRPDPHFVRYIRSTLFAEITTQLCLWRHDSAFRHKSYTTTISSFRNRSQKWRINRDKTEWP